MEKILAYFSSLNLDYSSLAITAGVLLVGSFVFGSIGRFVFGKHSVLADSASSSLGILAMYLIAFILCCCGVNIGFVQLPFMQLSIDGAAIFSFTGWDYKVISGQVLNMVILSFVTNLLDRWLPKGKNFLTWLIFRLLTIAGSVLCYSGALYLLRTFVPVDFMLYAPAILLALLVLMLATGALKVIVGVVLSTVNPLIAALYTFFFANIIGKQLTKAVFTTLLITLCAYLMDYLKIVFIPFGTSALIVFIPCLLVIFVLWKLLCKIF